MNDKRALLSDQTGDLGKEKDLPPEYPAYSTNALERPTSSTSFRTTFASVSLHMRDRIRLLRFSARDVDQIQELIKRSWPKGIQETRLYDQAHEIKLRGNPWHPSNWNDERTQARRLMCRTLEGLFDMGWVLKASVDISKKEFDKGAFSRCSLPSIVVDALSMTNRFSRYSHIPPSTASATTLHVDVHILRQWRPNAPDRCA